MRPDVSARRAACPGRAAAEANKNAPVISHINRGGASWPISRAALAAWIPYPPAVRAPMSWTIVPRRGAGRQGPGTGFASIASGHPGRAGKCRQQARCLPGGPLFAARLCASGRAAPVPRGPSRAALRLRRPAGPERAAAREARRAARRAAQRGGGATRRPTRARGARGPEAEESKRAHHHTGALLPTSTNAEMITRARGGGCVKGAQRPALGGRTLDAAAAVCNRAILCPAGPAGRPDAARPKRGPLPPPGSLRARRAGAVDGV